MKTYTITIEEDRVAKELEEIAAVAKVSPESFILGLVARTVAPQSITAQKFHPDPAQ
jgi:hypothetical protein